MIKGTRVVCESGKSTISIVEGKQLMSKIGKKKSNGSICILFRNRGVKSKCSRAKPWKQVASEEQG